MAKRGKTGGRGKGVPNKTTKQARELVGLVVEQNLPRLQRALSRLERKDPEAFVNALTRLLEFHIPKLARTELAGGKGVSFRSSIDFGG